MLSFKDQILYIIYLIIENLYIILIIYIVIVIYFVFRINAHLLQNVNIFADNNNNVNLL